MIKVTLKSINNKDVTKENIVKYRLSAYFKIIFVQQKNNYEAIKGNYFA